MAILQRHKDSIYGLNDELIALNDAITAEESARIAADGDLTTLNTTEQGSLVGAINEVLSTASAGASDSLQIANNLSDVDDVTVARTNLDVYSTTEVDDAINSAQLALGTNYSVATVAEMETLANTGGAGSATELTVGDNVFVTDDGDTKWAIYKTTSITEGDGTTTFDEAVVEKIMDEDVYLNAISAEAIKTSYESNDDTNAYTDADKAKVDFITVTQAIDLDDAVLKANLSQDLDTNAGIDVAPSADAVKAYADAAAAAGGSVPILETVTVVGSTITLTNAPKEGVSGIMNFGTVRYTDANGVSYDAPVTAGATGEEFIVSTNTTDQWDGNSVQVQYLYTADSATESGGGAI